MSSLVIRFVTHATHGPFGHRSGVLQIAYRLRRELTSASPHIAELEELLSWIDANLAEPTRFSTSRHPRAQNSAVSWIKASAVEHVRILRKLALFIEEVAQLQIDELRTDRPGYVVFEDDHQLVALPFADTPR